MKYFTTLIFLLAAAFLQAQVTFVIDSTPSKRDTLRITADSNNQENDISVNSTEATNKYLIRDLPNSSIEKPVNETLDIFPNSVSNKVHFPDDIEWGKHDSLVLSDVTGKTLVEINNFKGNPIPVCGLSPGVYFITIKSSKVIYNGQFIKN